MSFTSSFRQVRLIPKNDVLKQVYSIQYYMFYLVLMKTIYDPKKRSEYLLCCLFALFFCHQVCAQDHAVKFDFEEYKNPEQVAFVAERKPENQQEYPVPASGKVAEKKLFPCTVSISSTPEICFDGHNATATAVVTSGSGPFTYAWTPTPGGGQGTAFATGLVSQFYTVIVSNAQGSCMGNTMIAQPPAIVLNLQAEDPLCEFPPNGSASVTTSGGTGPYTYSWNDGPDSNITAVNNLPGGVNKLVVTDAVGCPVTVTFNLQSTPLPITVTPPNPVIDSGDVVQLTASGALSYVWTPAIGLSCTNCPNPLAHPDTTMVYTVTGTSADGCIGSTTVPIKVEHRCSDIFVPTIFSPNGDGQNDNLCVLGDCIVKMHLTIFNRWGEKVYETEEQTVCWDGELNGYQLETGAYMYKLDVLTQDGTQVNKGGSVAVVR